MKQLGFDGGLVLHDGSHHVFPGGFLFHRVLEDGWGTVASYFAGLGVWN